jgi:hypothetical protein
MAALLWILVWAAISGNLAQAQEWHTITFRADAPGVDANPLRGLVPYSSMGQTPDSFPHSLEWFYIPLSDVVKGPGDYDWAPLERQLTAIAAPAKITAE